MAICYQHDDKGIFFGKTDDYNGPLPHNCVSDAPPALPWNRVWPRWNGTAWELIEDHRSRRVTEGFALDLAQEATEYWLPSEGDDWQSPAREMKSAGPLPEGAVTTRPEKPKPTLKEAKADALSTIDTATSAAILAGFDYQTDPGTGTAEMLHFSYDRFDQQNFADSAIAMQLGAAAASEAIPTSTPWNAYRNWSKETGGELVVLQLTAATFLPLYTAALTHKATKMALGSGRKTQIETADSVAAIQALLDQWGL